MKGVHGYKVFTSEWKCGTFNHIKQYSCPGIFEEYVDPILCRQGMHFCVKLIDCFNNYDFNPKNKVAEVCAYGTVLSDGVKSVTDKLEIIREIPWDEVIRIVNTGNSCTGLDNAGDYNTGNYNTGDHNTGVMNAGNWNAGGYNIGSKNTGGYNTGGRNTGNYNAGSWNTGDDNIGSCNTGDFNIGYCNTGDHNTGDYNTGNMNVGCRNTGYGNFGDNNTGDWNISSFNTGCFMTEEQNIMMFNKPSDWTYRMWLDSQARFILTHIPRDHVKWVESDDMTVDEKIIYSEHETTGGYLKEIDGSDRVQIWWDNLDNESKEIIKSLPNFDPDIFYQCTGIKVD